MGFLSVHVTRQAALLVRKGELRGVCIWTEHVVDEDRPAERLTKVHVLVAQRALLPRSAMGYTLDGHTGEGVARDDLAAWLAARGWEILGQTEA